MGALRTSTSRNLSWLCQPSSRSPARVRSPSGPISLRHPLPRSLHPTTRTGTTPGAPQSPDTSTSDHQSVSRPSQRSTESGATMGPLPAIGSVARKVLQSLEALKLVTKDGNGGRVLTPQGRRDLDRISAQVKAAVAKK